eukprot:m.28537 g.28537  ORF g.28537 m.28537 type:complete len:336 (-) comp6059_c0_seq2:1513-2520(-)
MAVVLRDGGITYDVYKDIVKTLCEENVASDDIEGGAAKMADKHNVSTIIYNGIKSSLHQELQWNTRASKQMKMEYARLLQEINEPVENPRIVRVAEENCMDPASVTKDLVSNAIHQLQLSDKITEFILALANHKKKRKPRKASMSEASVIAAFEGIGKRKMYDMLVHDVVSALYHTSYSGPLHDIGSSLAGVEFEWCLYQLLRQRNIQFISEDAQRLVGERSTPDVRFKKPTFLQGQPIYWIDSKKKFGSPFWYKRDIIQLTRYTREIGPGLVVYWSGFVANGPELPILNILSLKGLFVCGTIPLDLTQMEEELDDEDDCEDLGDEISTKDDSED